MSFLKISSSESSRNTQSELTEQPQQRCFLHLNPQTFCYEVDPFLQDDGGFFFEAVRDEDDVKHKV